MGMTPLGGWLTTAEAAEMAGYHPNHIRRLLKRREIHGQKFGQTWMISKESLLAYLRKAETQGQRRGPKPEN